MDRICAFLFSIVAMKRQKQKPKRGGGQRANVTPGPVQSPSDDRSRAASSRRHLLRKAAGGAAAIAVIGGGGWYFVADVRATVREEDLSQIGNGIPAVVQIHDPQCPQCLALQREVRAALSAFDDGELQYLVANIRSPEGRGLANAHDVGHVTLLLFDGDGERRRVLAGPDTSEHLEQAFREHLAAGGT